MPVYTKLFGAFLVCAIVSYYTLCSLHISDIKKALCSKLLLLFLNAVFYVYADLRFMPFLVYVVAITYVAGKVISKHNGSWFFYVFAVLELLPLIALKTLDWMKIPGVFLPLGISFFTLQAFTYIYGVYRDEIAVSDLLSVALFVSFFPSITSGPILRAKDLVPQFQTIHPFEYDRFTDGLKLMAWGLFKKLVLADNMATYISFVNSEAFEYGNVSGTAFLLTSILYSFQLYLDFSMLSAFFLERSFVSSFELI